MSGRTTGAAAIVVVALVVASLQCRRAEGVAQNPIDREAEEALVAYLRIDTTNPPGNETAGAAYLRNLLAKNGIAARLVGDDPRRHGVYARLESGSREPALLLLSHIDVVPADPELWRNPPFAGIREGGYIWGRGAIDCKSLAIAELMALLDLKRRGAKLRRDVIFLAVPDEELGGRRGVKALLDRHPELFANVGHVLNEGGWNDTAIDRVRFWGIEVQQRVPLWVRITSEGTAGHGAASGRGGAPSKLLRALAAVEAIDTPYRLTEPVSRALTAGFAARRDSRFQPLLQEPLDSARVERLPVRIRALLRDSIAITRLSAGSAVNVMPSRATADVDIRLLPGTDPAPMLARVREAVGEHARVDVILSEPPAPETPASGELFATLVRVFRASEPGSVVAPVIGEGTTDSRYFRARGIAAYGISPFKVNSYDAESVHGNDERIRARFFSEGVGVMKKIVRDFCEAK